MQPVRWLRLCDHVVLIKKSDWSDSFVYTCDKHYYFRLRSFWSEIINSRSSGCLIGTHGTEPAFSRFIIGSKQAIKQTSKKASNQASEQAGKRASQPVSKQASMARVYTEPTDDAPAVTARRLIRGLRCTVLTLIFSHSGNL